MDDIVYKELSYRVTGLCFKVQKELGRFCRERQYADRLEELLKTEGLVYERELELCRVHEGSPAGNRVDFMIENKLILDAKAKPFITKDDYAQMQRYLRGADLKLGLVVNFKDTYLKPKRVLNSHHSHEFVDSHRSSGFTLIEMIVSIALFSFVMLAATSVLLKVVDANNKAQGLKTTMNNLSLTLESMARNLRTGSGYTQLDNNDQCPSKGEDNIGYIDQRGLNTFYRWNEGTIEISKGGRENYAPMTAPEVTIDRMCFYVSGQSSADFVQPKILMTVGGVVSLDSAVGAKVKTRSRFDIQTTVSQRFPDVAR